MSDHQISTSLFPTYLNTYINKKKKVFDETNIPIVAIRNNPIPMAIVAIGGV